VQSIFVEFRRRKVERNPVRDPLQSVDSFALRTDICLTAINDERRVDRVDARSLHNCANKLVCVQETARRVIDVLASRLASFASLTSATCLLLISQVTS
jgi:hypothetical protein